jgi:Flp pilus assembly protein TadD
MRLLVHAFIACLAFASPALQAQTAPTPVPLTEGPRDPTALQQVQALARAGQTTAALARADQALRANPKDAQMRFVRATLLADLGRNAEARAVFEQLTEDFPELAEPYNNLAVIAAAEGRLARAQELLRAALEANPKFATAYENLGDLYLRMATEAYEQAAKLAPGNRQTAAKLALAREIAAKLPRPRDAAPPSSAPVASPAAAPAAAPAATPR